MNRLKRIFREPLFHFFLLGAFIFLFYHWNLEETQISDDRHILVTKEQIHSIQENFAKAWQRNPTPEELKFLVDSHILEEMLYRSALNLGLNKNDTVIRRRLRQKMDFILEDMVVEDIPSDIDLEDFFNKNQNQFREEPEFSFIHILFSEGSEENRAKNLLEKLRMMEGEPQASSQGAGTLLEPEYQSASYAYIGGLFGTQFANQLIQLPTKQWQGPIESSYGFHLVYIKDRNDGYIPPFEKVKEEIRTKLIDEKRKNARERIYKNLKNEYTIKIENL